MEQRVETLVLPVEPKTVNMPKLDMNGSPWAAAAKLGRYLISGLDERSRDDLMLAVLRVMSGTENDESEPEPSSVASTFAKRTKTRARFLFADDIWYVTSMSAFPQSHCGLHYWLWTHDGNGRKAVGVYAFDLPTAVGALAVTTDCDIVERVLSREKYRTAPIRQRFFALATERWIVERNLAANRRYSTTHTASVFEDKLDFDDRHREAAEASCFAARFSHVELDNSVDLDEFAHLDHEFDELSGKGWLPAIGSDNVVRLRLCGRHHAIGVYSPTLKAIAIDPRALRSGAHEMAHAYDFEHGQLSAQNAFRPILDRQSKTLAGMNLSDSRYRYLSTPTEVFARAYELHLLDTGRASSMTSASVAALCEADESAAPLAQNLPAINEYFDSLGL